MQYFLPIFLIDKTRERHLVHEINIVVLVGLVRGLRAPLTFQEGPLIAVQDEQIRDTLNMVHLERHASGKKSVECFDEVILKSTLKAFTSRHKRCLLKGNLREKDDALLKIGISSSSHKRACFCREFWHVL
jgi:hypothetical protein